MPGATAVWEKQYAMIPGMRAKTVSKKRAGSFRKTGKAENGSISARTAKEIEIRKDESHDESDGEN